MREGKREINYLELIITWNAVRELTANRANKLLQSYRIIRQSNLIIQVEPTEEEFCCWLFIDKDNLNGSCLDRFEVI